MIEVLRERVGTFRRLAVEHGLPVVIGEPEPLPRNPELPVGLYDVFDLVGSVDTGDLRFAPPAEVAPSRRGGIATSTRSVRWVTRRRSARGAS